MALEKAIEVFGYEDYAFLWQHADRADISSYDLIFELMTDYDETPLVTRTIGSGITLAGTPVYLATVTLSSSNLSLAAGARVYTISKRNAGAKRELSYGPFVIQRPRVGRD